MKVEVDQSGKIGDTKVPTVLAFSNSSQFAILIPTKIKRECIQQIRGKRKMETKLYIQLFAVGLYLLLKKEIKSLGQVIIDFDIPDMKQK